MTGAILSCFEMRCVTMIDVMRHRPIPTPPRAWHPIWLDLEGIWMANVLQLTEEVIELMMRSGLKSPIAPTVTLIMIGVKARKKVAI